MARVFQRTSLISVLSLGFLLGACTTTQYLCHIAWGEARILLSQKPVEEMLRDPALPREQREKLMLIARTALEAQSYLKLKRDKQYRTYAHLETTFTVWVLTLAEPDRLKLITFRFPFFGEFPYIGFFSREKVELIASSYPQADRYLRQAAAFSTLGYLPEPILPNFLEMGTVELVRTVVHELVHATVFRLGDAPWSESVAMSLGDAGAYLLFKRWGMEKECQILEKRREDEQRFNRMLDRVSRDLEDYYAREPLQEKRLEYKRRRIAAFQEEIRNTSWNEEGYRRYAERPINHAFLLAHKVYAGDPLVQEQWYEVAKRAYSEAIRILSERGNSGEALWEPLPLKP